jgi:hypothetical protein
MSNTSFFFIESPLPLLLPIVIHDVQPLPGTQVVSIIPTFLCVYYKTKTNSVAHYKYDRYFIRQLCPQAYAAMRNKFGGHALKKIHEEYENVSEREAP